MVGDLHKRGTVEWSLFAEVGLRVSLVSFGLKLRLGGVGWGGFCSGGVGFVRVGWILLGRGGVYWCGWGRVGWGIISNKKGGESMGSDLSVQLPSVCVRGAGGVTPK